MFPLLFAESHEISWETVQMGFEEADLQAYIVLEILQIFKNCVNNLTAIRTFIIS